MAGKRKTSAIGCGLLWILTCVPAQAQPETERLVAITESVGYEIDPAERRKYALFAEYRGFLLAEVVSKGERYWLRISYRRDKDRLVEQIALSATELQALRGQIGAVDAEIRTGVRREAPTAAEKEGRLRLVKDGLLYGTFLYGPGTIAILDLGSSAAPGVELLIAGGAFAGALNATKEFRLGYGRTKLVRWGNFAGTFYGFGTPFLLGVDNHRVYIASAMALTPVGGYVNYRLTSGRRIRKGEADLISTGMYVGAAYGAAVPFLIDVSGLSDSAEAKVYLASSMAGVPAGALAATRLVRDRPINRGRALLITLGGLLGAADALTLVDLVDDGEHPRIYLLSAMLGAPAGALLGYRMTEDENYTLGRGRLITVGAYAGAIVGSGMLISVGIGNEKVLSVSAMLGATAGVWYTRRATTGWGDHVTRRAEPSTGAVRVSLPTPATLLTLGLLARHGAGHVPPVELLRIEF